MMDGRKALFSLRYAGSVDYYAAMLHYGLVGIDAAEHYDKRHKHLNRMDIVAANGLQSLSVPLQKPNRDMRVADIALSEHGNWRHNHWGALYSAYGRTPFFDYFADDLKRIYDDCSINTVGKLNLALHSAVVDFLDLPIQAVVAYEKDACEGFECADMRDGVFSATMMVKPYYQIWADKHGFRQGMSILDMLFNVGREAIFYLR